MWAFDNSYRRLPERFHTPLPPTPVASPSLLAFNRGLADSLNLEIDESDQTTPQLLAGNVLPPGSEPVASAYAGHQFGNFVPSLGDGRAVLLGEVIDSRGQRHDIQLKGAGPTPYSRNGDGRAALGPVLREYLVSEAMHALGIPTTRALAAVSTGEAVYRETAQPGAVLTRVAASHIRVGTFQYFAARNDTEALRLLADHVINRHYVDVASSDEPYPELLAAVVDSQARLVARWMQVGFIHGVMNTDNMTVSGETIDYGPCAFMDHYDPAAVFSAIDEGGRYAYANQPRIALWNLARLAETLLPLMGTNQELAINQATDVVTGFADLFRNYWLTGMRAKLGLLGEQPEDAELVQQLLDLMEQAGADFTLTFHGLATTASDVSASDPHGQFADQAALEGWISRWQRRLAQEPDSPEHRCRVMQEANPAVIPRNHLVEEALDAAVNHNDLTPFHRLLQVLSKPTETPELPDYMRPPTESERVRQTFCGT